MKKKHPEHVNLERWLVSYADFITLLFAFFVVMYAMANQDKAKIKQIVESIEKSFFGASGMIDMGTGKTINTLSNPMSIQGRILDMPMGRTNAQKIDVPDLEKIARRIEESIAYQFQTTDLNDHLEMVYDDRGLVIRLTASKLYSPGQIGVNIKNLLLIDKITGVILDTKRLIRVEGHSDAEDAKANKKYPTKWEISTGRAAWIVRYMAKKFKFPERRLSAAGYGDAHPISSPKTEDGRARNRRIEIVVTAVKDQRD